MAASHSCRRAGVVRAAPPLRCFRTAASFPTWAGGRTLPRLVRQGATTTASTWPSSCLGRRCDTKWTCREQGVAAMLHSPSCRCTTTSTHRSAMTTIATPTAFAVKLALRLMSRRRTALHGTRPCTARMTTWVPGAATAGARPAPRGRATGTACSTGLGPSAWTRRDPSRLQCLSLPQQRASWWPWRSRSRRTTVPVWCRPASTMASACRR
mmetsp:Transcript_100003/g.278550  ORF Transcript_100003/g.278550 Transcript_100003/m.278550 type:complete len:211 (-) Transcript_100003:154-786(-)